MREYTITKTTGAPDFSKIPSLPIDTLLWSPEVPITAQAQICYDDTGLYVKLSAQEPHIRAVEEGPLGVPCEDSCLEFFFRPMDDDIRYLNIECNPKGCIYLGFCNTGRRYVRQLFDEPPIQPAVQMVEGGWEVSYKIPKAFVQLYFPAFELTPGKIIWANCYKCGDLTVQEHYLSWNPITQEEPNFHLPEYFGKMILG